MRACQLTQFSRAAWYRRRQRDPQVALRLRIREIARLRPRFGYLRILVFLRREGWAINSKRPRVRPRKHTALHRGPAPQPAGPTERWSIDFVHDALADGRPFRVLAVVDQWSRQSPILEVASSMSGATVGQALDRVLPAGSTLRSLTLHHGTEFTARALEDWAYHRRVQLDFMRPGKPVDCGDRAFNGRLRDEC